MDFPQIIRLAGKIHPGNGRASATMDCTNLAELFGWRPHPGTLNVFLPVPAPWKRMRPSVRHKKQHYFEAIVRDPRDGGHRSRGCMLLRATNTTQPEHLLEVICDIPIREYWGLGLKDRIEVLLLLESI